MRKLGLILATTLCFAWVSTGHAQYDSDQQTHKRHQQSHHRKSLHDEFTGQPYGTAGCGLGSMVFADKPGMIQIVASTLNGIGLQSFGISSDTSNCGTSAVKQDRAALFIEVNKEALARDVARGNGESLVALAKIVGCQPESLGSELKQNYDHIFVDDSTAAETTKAIFDTIRANPSLNQCADLG